jgi:predicted acetyltransferase
MTVALRPVPHADKPTLAAIMQLYLYDSANHSGDEPDDRGLYPYRYFDLYWTEDSRFPFLITHDGRIAGLALVRLLEPGADPLHQIAEFFVMRPLRGQDVGRAAAVALFNRVPGRWEVAQLEANTAAQAFWRRVISDYTGGDYTERWVDDDEQRGPVQTFRSAPPGSAS